MTRGDRVVVLATGQYGEFAHVQVDGRVAVWLDEATGVLPTSFDALELEHARRHMMEPGSVDDSGFSDGIV